MAARLAPFMVAADGGAELVQQSGRIPDAVIGDLDSLCATIASQIPSEKVHAVAEQDSTDFEKVMMRVDAPVVLGVGLTGGRLDHELAAFHALRRFAHLPCVLIGESQLVFLCPPQIQIALEKGDTVSLFPLAPVEGMSTGLRWDIDGLHFAPGVRIGTSNMAIGGDVTVSVNAPAMLGILPRAALSTLVEALSLAPGWPVAPSVPE